MADYMYPSVFFSYFLFFLLTALTLFFFVRSARDGYWGQQGEDVKYRMLEDERRPADPGVANDAERRG